MSTSGVKVKLYTDAMLVYYTPGHQAHTDLAKPPLGRQVATMQSWRSIRCVPLPLAQSKVWVEQGVEVASWQLDTDRDAGFLR